MDSNPPNDGGIATVTNENLTIPGSEAGGQEINPDPAPVALAFDPEHQRLISAIEYVDIDKLKPHPLNGSIYGKAANEKLRESIRASGVLQPLLATYEKVVLAGHDRLEYAREVGLSQVPVVFTDSTDEDDMIEVLLDSNRQREKTPEQLAREIDQHRRLERLKAAKRQATASKGKRGGQSDPAISPEAIGDVRKIVAKTVGVGVKTVDAAVTAIKAIEEFEQAGEPENARQVERALNQSINAGKNKALELKKPKIPDKPKVTSTDRKKKDLIRMIAGELTHDLTKWPVERLEEFLPAATAFRTDWESANPHNGKSAVATLPEAVAA